MKISIVPSISEGLRAIYANILSADAADETVETNNGAVNEAGNARQAKQQMKQFNNLASSAASPAANEIRHVVSPQLRDQFPLLRWSDQAQRCTILEIVGRIVWRG